MKGLLIKDIRLMMGQKASVVIILILGVFIGLSQNDINFAVSYIAFVGTVFALSTISYDSFENGMTFLMTLPIQRKTYALEKYVFSFTFSGILATIVCAVGMVVLGGNMEAAQIQDVLSNFGASLMIVVILLSIMIPVHLKFGPEKGRMVMLIVAGIVMGGYYALTQYFTEETMQALAFLKEINLSELQFGFVFVAVAAVMLLISLAVSVKVLKNKEY
ncbi:MAG: ABC-2 transporter permease [Lachnospiraceae bacterium]|nr:ABC-2 transporter permease [Lachnospiraceae bacterium]